MAFLSRWRGRRRAIVALTGALAVVAVTGVSVEPTSAAWVDAANASASASSGAWPFAPGTCAVEKLAGYTGTWNDPTCTVTALVTRGEVWGTAGSRSANAYLAVSFSNPVPGDQLSNVRVVLRLNLVATQGLPTDWVWMNAGVVDGNLSHYPGYTCATLAQSGAPLTALAPSWAWSSPSLYFRIVENRSGTSNLICS